MTDADYPWEPPMAGTEAEHLTGALDRLRTTFRWKAGGLDAAGLQHRVAASSLTLGGLLKHLALVEEYYSATKLHGEPPGAPWNAVDWDADPDWEFTSSAADPPQQLYALWDGAVERSRARIDAALTDGGDGLSIIEKIIAGATKFLRADGFLIMEIGIDQAGDVEAMFDMKIWREMEILPDLQGIPRTVKARKFAK